MQLELELDKLVNMASTRSKSKCDKNLNNSTSDTESIPLNIVKELLKVQESNIKSFPPIWKIPTVESMV